MSFHLAGVSGLHLPLLKDDGRKPTSRFLIPFFAGGTTNYSYAQELCFDGTVADFVPFEPDRYGALIGSFPGQALQVGEEGMLAVWHANSLLIASVSDVKDYLTGQAFNEQEPFFEMEIASLLGDEARFEQSLRIAGRRLPQGRTRTFWFSNHSSRQAVERAASQSRGDGPLSSAGLQADLFGQDEFEVEFSALSNALADPNWVTRLEALRTRFGVRDDLLGLATGWLKLNQFGREGYSRLLYYVLKSVPSQSSLEAQAIKWLEHSSLSDLYWPKIWRRLASQYELWEPGTRYLEHALISRSQSSAIWVQVWSKLFNSDHRAAFLPALEKLAMSARERWAPDARMVSAVYVPLARLSADHDLWLDAATSDLLADERIGRNWVEAVRGVLGRRASPDLFAKALRALDSLALRTRGWPRLWLALYEVGDQRNTLLDRAEEWLQVAATEIVDWGDVLLSYFETRRDIEDFLAGAARWIAANPKAVSVSAVAELLYLASSDDHKSSTTKQHEFSWRITIARSLERLGGRGTLEQIYDAVASERRTPLPQAWRSIVRRTLGDFSRTSAHYRGVELFERIGPGLWKLADGKPG